MIDALLPPDTDNRKPEYFQRCSGLMKENVEIVRTNVITEMREERQKGLQPFQNEGIPAASPFDKEIRRCAAGSLMTVCVADTSGRGIAEDLLLNMSAWWSFCGDVASVAVVHW